MRKLLRADFKRLWQNKLFWTGMICMLIIGIYVIAGVWHENAADPEYAVTAADSFLLGGCAIVAIISAIFSAFFIGTEYSDGGMRNKLVVGHSRIAIYCSSFLVCFAAAVIMNLVYIILVLTVATRLIGPFVASAAVVAQLLAFVLVPMAALTSLYLLLEILISNKAAAITVLILFSFGIESYQGIIADRLSTPEYYEAYTWTDDDGNEHEVPRERNSSYPTGWKRQYYETMQDIIPVGQISLMNTMLMDSADSKEPLTQEDYEHILIYMGYSICIIVISSGAGIFFFRKKNIR